MNIVASFLGEIVGHLLIFGTLGLILGYISGLLIYLIFKKLPIWVIAIMSIFTATLYVSFVSYILRGVIEDYKNSLTIFGFVIGITIYNLLRRSMMPKQIEIINEPIKPKKGDILVHTYRKNKISDESDHSQYLPK